MIKSSSNPLSWLVKWLGYANVSGALILVLVGVWYFAQGPDGRSQSWPIAVGGLILALIICLAHVPRVADLLFGLLDPTDENPHKVTIGSIVSFVGLISLDMAYLNMVNTARDNALTKNGPADYSSDWLFMQFGHILVFIGVLTCVAWFSRHLKGNVRSLRTLWSFTLAIFLLHCWGKFDDARRILIRQHAPQHVERQFEDALRNKIAKDKSGETGQVAALCQ